MEREKLGSRLGFILLSAGCAIGIGNVWKFPYLAGQYGGAAFVLFYILFLLFLGLPIMTMEFSVGRASRKSPVLAYSVLEKPGQKWHLHGYLCLIGNYLLMMFYTSVTGWMLHYFYLMVSGAFVGQDTAGVSAIYSQMLGQPLVMGGWMVLVVVLGFAINSFGLQNGLERITKYMMIALLFLIVALAVNSVSLSGAGEGLKFYLVPDIQRMMDVGVGATIVGAMNQSFFTLSLGIGAMAIFGSYIGKDRALLGESVNVAVLDTFVAITSGLIIFPACFTYGVEADSGPNLIFITLPNVFNHMPMGQLWGSLFFVFLFFASMSTILAVFENIMACWMDLTGMSRRKGRQHQPGADAGAVAALRAGFQSVGRLPALRRRLHHYGSGRFPGVQYLAAYRLADLPAVLHVPLRLGLEELYPGGQHRQGPEGGQLDALVCDVSAAHCDPGYFPHRHQRQIPHHPGPVRALRKKNRSRRSAVRRDRVVLCWKITPDRKEMSLPLHSCPCRKNATIRRSRA